MYILRQKKTKPYTIAPFYLLLAFKLTSDGLMRGCGLMGRFMATTLSDLFLRVVLAILFSRWLGVNGIWLSWPVGWFVGTLLILGQDLDLLARSWATPRQLSS